MLTVRKTAIYIFFLLQILLQNNAFAHDQHIYTRRDPCTNQPYNARDRYRNMLNQQRGVFYRSGGAHQRQLTVVLDGNPYTRDIVEEFVEVFAMFSASVDHHLALHEATTAVPANLLIRNPGPDVPPVFPLPPGGDLYLGIGLPIGIDNRAVFPRDPDLMGTAGSLSFARDHDYQYAFQVGWDKYRQDHPGVSLDQYFRMRIRFLLISMVGGALGITHEPHSSTIPADIFVYTYRNSVEVPVIRESFAEYLEKWETINRRTMTVEDIKLSDMEIDTLNKMNKVK